jgi:predicted Zn-dependent peptidase
MPVFYRGEMMKTIQDQLKKWKQLNPSPKKKHKRKKPQQAREEKLRDRDIRDLMGMNKPRYRRNKGGAYRRDVYVTDPAILREMLL